MRPGPWSALERAAYDTCEPDVAALLVHPGETLSGLAVLAAAVVSWHEVHRSPVAGPARFLPAILALLSAASMLFHATFAAVFQQLDLAAIPLFTGLLLAAALVHGGYVERDRWPALFAVFAGCGAVLPFIATVAGYVVVTAQAAALIRLWWKLARTQPAIRTDLRRTVVLLLPAAALLALGHAGIACTGAGSAWAHLAQPHIAWHLASAAACVFIVRIELALERDAVWLRS
ncbi:MAG: hypothetical protein J4G16_05885 [Acidobacteria bacterium]|nr:hypothetical protein [Acidobacteriota bacterium]